MAGVTKRFGRVTVLQDVRFEVRAGEVHVLAGENGAGKSTLIKILAGVHTDAEGEIEIAGRKVRPRSPLEANALGVAVIHQELSLIGPMSVADNIFLGRNLVRMGFVKGADQREQARSWMRRLGLEIDVEEPVERFPVGIRQLVEIAKALSREARVLVMDEPTSALNAHEVEKLFEIIESLKADSRGIVYITHRMEEIQRLADRITVLRDGRWIGTAPAKELPIPQLIRWMVGREAGLGFPPRASRAGEELLRVRNFSVLQQKSKPCVCGVSFSVQAGEIVGIAGLQGSGAGELLLGLFGAYGSMTAGEVKLKGEPVRIASPRQAIASGIALLTNDRKATGLVFSMSIVPNVTLARLRVFSPGGWRQSGRERAAAEEMGRTLKWRAPSLDVEPGALSGGNQQKVALAKWLLTKPALLMLDEPTRGIDVLAKHEVYQLMDAWAARGIGILLITSEMEELLGMSDRILVMHRGELTAEFRRGEASPDLVLAAAMGQAGRRSTPHLESDAEDI
jgi:ABC-type sugar transport system ATPase subunit